MHAAGSKRKHEHEKPDRKTEHSGNGNGRNNERIDNDNSDSGDNESSGSSTGSTNNNNNAKDKRIDITVKSGNIGESPYSKRVLVSESPMKVDPAPAQQVLAPSLKKTLFPRAATSMFGGETALTTWEDVADGTNTKEQSSKSTASENTIQSTPSVYKSAALTVFGSSSVHVFGTGTSTANTSFASLASNKSSSFSSIVASTATENVNMNEKPKTVENESNPFGSVAFGDAGRSKFPFSSSSFGSFASIAKSNSDATNNSGKTNPTDTIIGGDKNNDNDNNESNNAGQKLSDSPVTIFVLKEDASKLSDHKASSITEPPAPAASTFNSTPFNSFTSSVSFGGSFAGRETVETAVGSDALKSNSTLKAVSFSSSEPAFGSKSSVSMSFGVAATTTGANTSKSSSSFEEMLKTSAKPSVSRSFKTAEKVTGEEDDDENTAGSDGEENAETEVPIEKKVDIPVIEVKTGEEDESNVFHLRCKLFRMDDTNNWKERGVGNLKLNCDETTATARLVMRAEGVLRLILNVRVIPGMPCQIVQEKYVQFACPEDVGDRFARFLVKTANANAAVKLLEHIRAFSETSSV